MELKARLNHVRNRLLLQTFLRRLGLALACSLTAGALLLLTAPFTGFNVAPLTVLMVAITAALIAAVIATALNDNSHLQAARLLERDDPTLHAQLSTALELMMRGNNTSELRQVQLQAATELAGQLNAVKRVPLRLPRPVTTFLVGGATVMVTALLVYRPFETPVTPTHTAVDQPSATLSQDEQTNLSAGLQQIAELFSPQDDSPADPYLEAIGRQLQELGTRLSSEQLSREQLSEELERLLQHTQTALELRTEQAADSPQADLTGLLEAALREIQQPEEPVLAEAPAESGSQVAESDGAELLDGMNESQEASAEQTPPSLQDLLAEDQEEPAAGQSQGSAQQAQRTGSYFDYAIDERTMAELNARAMEQALSEAAGEAIGASSQSQEGASSLAGDGTDELFGSETAEQLNAERIEQLSVNEETDPEGRHVRIEVNPEAEFTEVFVTPLGDTAWSRSNESAVLREALMTDQRTVTARYHTPEQSQ